MASSWQVKEPDPRAHEFSAQERERIAASFRRRHRLQSLLWVLPLLGLIVLGLFSPEAYKEHWKVVVAVLLLSTLARILVLMGCRCPACREMLGKHLPNEQQKACPSCGSILID